MNIHKEYIWIWIMAGSVLLIWDTVWTAIALWKAGRNNQLSWFICLVIFNTVGILPILYIQFFQNDRK